jgi:hypothetical protein
LWDYLRVKCAVMHQSQKHEGLRVNAQKAALESQPKPSTGKRACAARAARLEAAHRSGALELEQNSLLRRACREG